MLQSVLRHHSLSGLCSGSDGLRSISAIGCDFSGRDGIGICSVEEIGSLVETPQASGESKKLPSQPANGNYGGPKVRDRLCQIIRQHQLDPNLEKAYATDFCGAKASRRLLDHWPPLLHRQSDVEIELVPARLRLRHRTAWVKTKSMIRLWSDYKAC